MTTMHPVCDNSAVTINLRVILALMLREIHTINGNSSLGYFWTVAQTAFGVAVFWGVRFFMHAAPPHGMTVLSFLVLGFLIWNIFKKTVTANMQAVEANRALLTYPHVFALDIMIARSIVITATQVVSMSLILSAGMLLGYSVAISDAGLLLAAILFAMIFGLGCGIIFSALALYAPALPKLVPMALRILFFASGVFFSVSAFSNRVGAWLLLNPIMQLIEMARSAMSGGYVSPYFDVHYLLVVNLSVLTTGLLLERFARRRLQA